VQDSGRPPAHYSAERARFYFFTGCYGGSVEYESGELAAKLGSNLVVEESSVMKDSPQSPSFIVAPLANPQSMN
jgi:hypothetical protein